jgi:carboxyl-terminal processing protease
MMGMQFVHAAALATSMSAMTVLAAQTREEFAHDFEVAITRIASSYAYFDVKATRWADLTRLYAADLDHVTNRHQFIALLERIVDELYDPHAQLTVNLSESPRLVPSGTDLWAEWRAGQATITQVRAESDAERAGIKANAVVVALDGIPIADAVEARMGRSYPRAVAEARDWALRAVLAGRHRAPRLLQIQEGGARRTVALPAADQFAGAVPGVTASEIRPGIGYIRFNDSLGDNSTVASLDQALTKLRDTRGLILDLRNTPSGGNSSVARGILGRFVNKEQPYQKHVLPSEERDTRIRRSWLELVSPRGDFIYSRPVAVLVNRWTGSMGEGLAIGFDGTHSGVVVGTPMAGLLGATDRITLPRTDIGINLPSERLYHVNGTPRERFRPAVPVDVVGSRRGEDPFIAAALQVLAKQESQ